MKLRKSVESFKKKSSENVAQKVSSQMGGVSESQKNEIKKIVEDTGVQIDIEDNGKVSILSNDAPSANKAIEIITNLTKEVQVGEIYLGKVVRIMDFGAFVEVLPGKDGLVHISQLALERVKKVEDVVNIGDEIMVKVIEIDKQGRINLSRKELLKEEQKNNQ